MTDELKNWVVRLTEVIDPFGPYIETQHYLVLPLPEREANYFTMVLDYATRTTKSKADILCEMERRRCLMEGLGNGVVSRVFESVQVPA